MDIKVAGDGWWIMIMNEIGIIYFVCVCMRGSLTRSHALFCEKMWGSSRHTNTLVVWSNEQSFSCSFVMRLLWFAFFPILFLQHVCFHLSQMAACLSVLEILLKFFSTHLFSAYFKQTAEVSNWKEGKKGRNLWTDYLFSFLSPQALENDMETCGQALHRAKRRIKHPRPIEFFRLNNWKCCSN